MSRLTTSDIDVINTFIKERDIEGLRWCISRIDVRKRRKMELVVKGNAPLIYIIYWFYKKCELYNGRKQPIEVS